MHATDGVRRRSSKILLKLLVCFTVIVIRTSVQTIGQLTWKLIKIVARARCNMI